MGFSLLLSSLVAELAFGVRDSQQLSSSQLLLPRPLPTPVSQRMVPNHNAQLLTHAHHPGGGGFEAERICRICLEGSDHTSELHAERLISPCSCRGTQGWVHRGCLDQWRATREDRAFSHCTECHFAYAYVPHTAGEERALLGLVSRTKLRRLKYRLMLTRDFLGVFIAVQLAIWCIEAALHKLDCGNWFCGGDTKLNNAGSAAVCCPHGRIQSLFHPASFWDKHTASAYYLISAVIFFAVFGLIVSCKEKGCGCCNGGGRRNGSSCNDSTSCDGCYYGSGNGNGCDSCECGDCGGEANPFLVFLLAIAVVATIFFALVGIFEGMVFLAAVTQRSAQRHMHILQKRNLAQQFVVRHLSAADLETLALERVRYEPSAPSLPAPAASVTPPTSSHKGFKSWGDAMERDPGEEDANRGTFPTW